MAELFDRQVHQLVFVSAILLLVTMGISFVLPLDHPDAFAADHSERVAWLVENRSSFVLGWLNQIAAMVTLTIVLGGFAWLARLKSPMAALLAGLVLFASFIAFIVPKFIAVWTLPQLAQTAHLATGSTMADALLAMLNVSIPYSLFTSFDYLGFWLYAVFALLVFRHVWGECLSRKLASVSLFVFGAAYHLVVGGVLSGSISTETIEAYALTVSLLLVLIALFALGISIITLFLAIESLACIIFSGNCDVIDLLILDSRGRVVVMFAIGYGFLLAALLKSIISRLKN